MFRQFKPYIGSDRTSFFEIDFPGIDKIKVGQKIYFFIDELHEYRVESVGKRNIRIGRYKSNKKGSKIGSSFNIDGTDMNRQCFLSIADFKKYVRKTIKDEIAIQEHKINEMRNHLEETYGDD